MTGLVLFGDAESVVAKQLRTDLAARSEPYLAGVTVGTRVPVDRASLTGIPPLVVVTQDGPGAVRLGANVGATLRVAVWHGTDDDAFDLAGLCLALIATYAGPVVRSARMLLSPVRAADPTTGAAMAWGTAYVNVKPAVRT